MDDHQDKIMLWYQEAPSTRVLADYRPPHRTGHLPMILLPLMNIYYLLRRYYVFDTNLLDDWKLMGYYLVNF